jgi:hypothetical protein
MNKLILASWLFMSCGSNKIEIHSAYIKGNSKILNLQLSTLLIDSTSAEGIPVKYRQDTVIYFFPNCSIPCKTGNDSYEKSDSCCYTNDLRVYFYRNNQGFHWTFLKPDTIYNSEYLPIKFVNGKWYEITRISDGRGQEADKVLFYFINSKETKSHYVKSNLSPI